MTCSGYELTERHWRVVAVATGVLLLPVMLWMSSDFGVTWDELHRQFNGERIWDLYRGVVRRSPNAAEHLYGGLFDVLAVSLQRALPAMDLYLVRHLLNATFGWLGIVFAGGLAWAIAGPACAVLAMVMLAFIPPYMGHSMNNPKDLPFATFATGTLMVVAWLPRTYPYVPAKHAIALGTMIGLTLAVRPGGLLFAPYAALWVAVTLVAARELNPRRLAITAAALLGAVLLAFVVPMPVWPYLWERPFIGVFEAVEAVSDFEWRGTVLFNGRDVQSTEMPWTYVPQWLTYTMPPVVLAGAALSVWSLWRTATLRKAVLGLWFAVLFPIGYVIARQSTLYDGIRHLLFVVPPLAVLAAIGWWWAVGHTQRRVRAVAIALLAVGLAEPLVFQVRNHPNQYVYFSPLVGGPAGVWTEFELDYWGNCLHETAKHAAEIARASGAPIIVSGRNDRLVRLNARRVSAVAPTFSARGTHEIEFRLLRGTRASLRDFSTRTDILWLVTTADGAPLCAALPGPRFRQLYERLERRQAAHLVRPMRVE